MDFSLTQIHRQAEGSAIIRYSVGLRTGDPNALFFTGRDNGDDGGALMRVKMSFLRDSHFVRADQVICGKNDTRHRLNARIREHLGHRSPYPQNGDKVICLRNNTQRMLVNGMIGRATRDGYDYDTSKGIFHMDVEIDGQTMINLPVFLPYFTDPGNEEAWEGVPKWSKYNKEHYHFDYGYAITAHKCVSPGTIVHTSAGIMRLGDLDNGAGVGEFRPLGDKLVQGLRGLEKALDFYNSGVGPVMDVVTAWGTKLTATPDHRVLVLGEGGVLEERLVRDLKVGDRLPVPRRTAGFGVDPEIGYVSSREKWHQDDEAKVLPERMTPVLAELLGMLVGGGRLDTRAAIFKTSEKELVDRIAKLVLQLFRKVVHVRDWSFKTSPVRDFHCYIGGMQLIEFLKHVLGAGESRDAWRTEVPRLILGSGGESQRGFLRGWANCRGKVPMVSGRCDRVVLETTHPRLCEHVRAMLHNFGVVVKVSKNTKARFVMTANVEYSRIFQEEIGFLQAQKRDRLASVTTRKRAHCRKDALPFLRRVAARLLRDAHVTQAGILRHGTLDMAITQNELRRVLEACRDLSGTDEYRRLSELNSVYTFDHVASVGEEREERTVCLRMETTGSFVQNGILALNSQGSQYDNGIIIEQPLGRTDVMRRRWRYTAVTRFAKNVVIAF